MSVETVFTPPVAIPDRHVLNVPARTIVPGYVLLYGVVVAVDDDGQTLHTADGNVTVTDSPDEMVTVLGRVSPIILAACQEMAARR